MVAKHIYLVGEYEIGNFWGVSCVRKRRTSPKEINNVMISELF